MKNTIKIIVFLAILLAALFITQSYTKAATREVTDESTLISEINAANPGDTISIKNNITITQPIVIAKELIIDGNGFSLIGDEGWTSTSGNQTMITAQLSNAKLTLKNINLVRGPKYGVQSYDGATVILDNVNITDFKYGGVLVNAGKLEIRDLHLGRNGTGENNGIEIDKGSSATNNPSIVMNGILKSDSTENIVRAATNGSLTEFTIENTEDTKNKLFATSEALVLTDEYNNVISQTDLSDTITPNVNKEKVFVTIAFEDKTIKIVVNKDEKITSDLIASHIVLDENHKIDGFYTDETYKTEFDFNQAISTETVIYVKISEIPTEPVPEEPEETPEEEKDDIPKTGVNSYLGMATFIIVIATCGILYIKKH